MAFNMASWFQGPMVGKNSSSSTILHGATNSVPKLSIVYALVLGTIVYYGVFVVVYNLLFHPLAKFPGPFLGRASLLWRFFHSSRGKIHLAIADLHRRYGPVVRVSPNELSFASVESWKAVYGHPLPGKQIASKAPFYEVFAAGFSKRCVGSERDPSKHSAMRKMLNPAFSQRSLLEQESIIGSIIDQFIHICGTEGSRSPSGINVTKWFEMLTFDILGEMAFGESFSGLKTGKPHFWADIVLEHLYFITLADNLRRIGAIAAIFRYLIPSSLIVQNQNSRYSRNQVDKILASDRERKDFVTLLAQKVKNGEVDKEEMTAHVSTFTIAGGETVATFLAATCHFLIKNPSTMRTLVGEIRGAFASYEKISAQAAQQLPYLQAVINEGLRIFPPGSGGAPRISPGFELHGMYIPKGAEIYTSPWSVTHDPQYFEQPFEFRPERWLDTDSRDDKEASQPFLLGPRACLGRNFAYMEMSLILTKMLWSYDLELISKNVDWMRDGQVHTLWWKPKMFIRFHTPTRDKETATAS